MTYAETKSCTDCGKPENLNVVNGAMSKVEEDGVCWLCHFWLKWVEAANDPNSVRVGGEHSHISPDGKTQHGFTGFGGREFRIRFHDGREVTTHNLWWQGVIPENFRDRLPDNAVWLCGGKWGNQPCQFAQGHEGDHVPVEAVA